MPWLVSVGYGAIGGLGSGCAYSLLVAVPQAWFPDKRGLVTGITMGAVGISGVIMNPICDYVLAAGGYRNAMMMVTLLYAILCLGAFFIEEAPTELAVQGAKPSSVQGGTAFNAGSQKQYTTREMIKTKRFYIICAVMALAIPAYVLVNPLMKSLGMERGLTNGQALAGVVIASFANIIGRFVMPWLSDKVGCRVVIRGLYVAATISVLGLTVARGVLFILFISLVCLMYGGIVSVFPVLVSEHFGMKYQGMNFGAVMIGYGIVSILCPYLLDVAGQSLSFIIAGVACGIGLLGTG